MILLLFVKSLFLYLKQTHMIGLLFFFHYVADFMCQSRMMGENKSKSFEWLITHVSVYIIVLGILSFPLFESWIGFTFWIVINYCLHLTTDFITSRLSTYFYLKKNMYGFWNVIGIDQTIHFVTLYYTYTWLT